MKFTNIFIVVLLTASITFSQKKEMKKLELKTFEDSVSYSIGQSIGKNLKDQDVNINVDCLNQGIKDHLINSSMLNEADMQKVLTAFNQKIMAKRNESLAAEKEKNKREGEAFLEANKKKEGVKTLADGMQYKVIKSGTGPMPKDTNTVKVDYRGTLIDGTEFDSSYKRGKPAEFPVNRVIKGWTEALQLMHVGDKWQLFIPSELAYGENGAGQVIGPNSTLIFEVELLGIVK